MALAACQYKRQLIECNRSLTSAECAAERRMAAQPPNATLRLQSNQWPLRPVGIRGRSSQAEFRTEDGMQSAKRIEEARWKGQRWWCTNGKRLSEAEDGSRVVSRGKEVSW